MKKIGFVTPWYGADIPGGAEMELRGLAEHLAESHVDLEVLTTCVEKFNSDWNVNYYPEGTEEINGVMVKRFPVRKRDVKKFDRINYKFIKNLSVTIEEEDEFLKEMVNSPRLYQYMEEHRDAYSLFVFIPYMFGTTYYGCEKCLDQAVLIPCLHDESYAYMKRFKERYSRVKGMVFNAKAESVLANKLYDLSRAEHMVAGIGMHTDVVSDADRFRKKYKIDAPFILYAGRKEAGKNVDTLVRYFGEYKKRTKSGLKLVLIGGGSIQIPKELTHDVMDLGFVPVQDKYDAYAAAELLCNPSKFESFSLIIMESWLCGRPVLVYAGCEVTKDFVTESNGGLYFYDYFEFEACVNYMLEHKETSEAMGENGRGYVINNFSWPVVVDKYKNFFEKCIS